MKRLTDSRVDYSDRLFRIRNGQDRALIAEIGVALAKADGYIFDLNDFAWMSWTSMQMACDGQTVQRRAVWYAEKARSILPIVKGNQSSTSDEDDLVTQHQEILKELRRELAMRRKCYPNWVADG